MWERDNCWIGYLVLDLFMVKIVYVLLMEINLMGKLVKRLG